ncbi:hypothetical protein K7X08_005766 [Anisodus acutangulus]|uniref:Uncharacterized protein n=1 Tax=Anisodus acutangulus TaxID=402998 RepID=A0A9Q1R5A8_9SOLA|nr:hypothetical protein K7X08_005766 [Anisodus acutangulus]
MRGMKIQLLGMQWMSGRMRMKTKKEKLQVKDDALVNFKSEFSVVEIEIQVLVKLAEEIAKSDIPVGSRRINGRYIQSHLCSGLEGA